MIPSLADATVISQDPDRYSVLVMLHGEFGGQGPLLSVQVLTAGPRDAVRGTYPELPIIGQTGVVAFTRGDARNGRWIGSFSPNLLDASTLSPGVGNVDYRASFGGGWAIRNEDGSEATWWPDGSHLVAGLSGLPAPTRHTLDANQAPQRTPFTAGERVPSPPGPFPFTFTHQTGAVAQVTAAGAVLAEAAGGQTATVEANGGSFVVGAAGQITATAASGQTATVTANGATIVIDASGNVTVTTASGGTAAVTAARIELGDGGVLQGLMNAAAVAVYNAHIHPTPSGDSGVPAVLMGSSDLTSVVTAQ